MIATAPLVFRQPAPPESPLQDDRIVYLGPDQDGVLLEVVAVEIEGGLLVIHAMTMRPRYRKQLEGEDDA